MAMDEVLKTMQGSSQARAPHVSAGWMLLWGSAPAPCCTHGQQGSTSPIHVQIILLESNLWVWFPSGQGAVLLLSLSQEHRWCGGFFIFFSPEAKGRTP